MFAGSRLDLAQDVSEFPQSKVSNFKYRQIIPRQSISENIPSGQYQYIFNIGGDERWDPKGSIFRVRFTLIPTAAGLLFTGDDIGVSFDPAANLFSQGLVRLNGQQISTTNSRYPQIDALVKRLYNPKDYFDGFGSASFLSADWYDRRTPFGTDIGNMEDNNKVDLGFDTDTTVAYTHATKLVTFAGTDVPNILTSGVIKIGDVIVFASGEIGQIETLASATTATFAANYNPGADIAAISFLVRSRQSEPVPKAYQQELVYHPSALGFMNTDRLIPKSNIEITMTIDSDFRQKFVESLVADKTNGSDYTLTIHSITYYALMMKAPVFKMPYYSLRINNVICHTRALLSNTGQITMDVAPSTRAITVAFQNTNATSNDTRYSPTKFRVLATGDTDIKLTRLLVQYAGQSKPDPQADGDYTANQKNYTVQRYHDTYIHNGEMNYDQYPESYNDWYKRGPIYHFIFEKDGTDTSTNVQIHYSIGSATDTNMLVFEHKTTYARVTYGNTGLVSSVNVIDA